ncbi:hypothetical protein [Candidatus Thiosymbion oneisti]|uniref:hypothetical protein n=1 Tax=Candidatus Thiosymbion oneisti TaxID=589554 RepID=UPI00106034EA|nr:hypothetical protein [Candidatus Thiosymbion oneisti]
MWSGYLPRYALTELKGHAEQKGGIGCQLCINTDARLRATIAEAASAEEDAAIKQLTRDELANAKAWEQRRKTAKHIKETREDWQKTILGSGSV